MITKYNKQLSNISGPLIFYQNFALNLLLSEMGVDSLLTKIYIRVVGPGVLEKSSGGQKVMFDLNYYFREKAFEPFVVQFPEMEVGFVRRKAY